jgi:hypothetical protein
MSDINQDVIDNLVKNIMYAINTNNNTNHDIIAPVLAINGNKITVLINGVKYDIKNGIGVNFSVGDRCLVHCINGKFQNKVIIAKL